MCSRQARRRSWLLASTVLVLALTTPACSATFSPALGPTATAEPTHTPAATKTATPTETPESTDTPTPTNTAEPTNTPKPTRTPRPTATPGPVGEVDTGMGGKLSIRGVVRDSSGKTVPGIYVVLLVTGEMGGWGMGQLGEWDLYTDEQGSYSFENLIRSPGGHYQVWFNAYHEYGKTYEESEYWINEYEITGDAYVLNVTVHLVTGSAFCGMIQYEGANGSIIDFYSPPLNQPQADHLIELWRGTPDNAEYPIGCSYGTISDSTVEYSGLAGGTYFLQFTYRRHDGVLLQCRSPSFEIPPGETKRFEYMIRNCPPMPGLLLP